MSINRFLPFFIILTMFLACKTVKLGVVEGFPDPKDTSDKPILYQEKGVFKQGVITADNTFNGARLNGFDQINDTTYRVTILPENEPINSSPHFAFSLQAEETTDIDLEIYYGDHKHRYWPKLSTDKETWFPIDSSQFDTLKAGNLATLKLQVNSEKLYVSTQELMDTEYNLEWSQTISQSENVELSVIGKSKLGRDILCLDICKGPKKKKPTIIIFSRLHPPEISGYVAMMSFVEELLKDKPLSDSFLEKHRVLVYPLINPDGVDMGHWRHNARGIDINRDWSHYRQEEVKVVATHAINTVNKNKNKVLAGFDFHSTQEDLYYTLTPNRSSTIFPFKDLWIQGIDDALDGYTPQDEPYDLNSPITKGWFYLLFDAEGITYEIGDETDRAFVKKKAEVAAREMMKLLVLRK